MKILNFALIAVLVSIPFASVQAQTFSIPSVDDQTWTVDQAVSFTLPAAENGDYYVSCSSSHSSCVDGRLAITDERVRYYIHPDIHRNTNTEDEHFLPGLDGLFWVDARGGATYSDSPIQIQGTPSRATETPVTLTYVAIRVRAGRSSAPEIPDDQPRSASREVVVVVCPVGGCAPPAMNVEMMTSPDESANSPRPQSDGNVEMMTSPAPNAQAQTSGGDDGGGSSGSSSGEAIAAVAVIGGIVYAFKRSIPGVGFVPYASFSNDIRTFGFSVKPKVNWSFDLSATENFGSDLETEKHTPIYKAKIEYRF